jgi:iron complex outermembrane receptor protein
VSPGCRIRGGLDARFDDFAENVGDVAVSRVGNTPPAVPEKMANLWVSWNQSNWQVQGGVRYVGSHYLNNANTTSTPSYTVADGGVRRRLNDRVGVDLRLYNLLDAFYGHSIYGGAAAPHWLVGRPRSAEVAITASF